MEIEEAKLGKSKFELNPPSLFKYLEEKKSEFVNRILEVARLAEKMLSLIPSTFKEYTLHDIDHSIRMIDYMFQLMPNIEELSELEITILIYSALLHDIGMYCSDDERNRITNNDYSYSELHFSSILHKYGGDETEAIKYFVRVNHAKRSAIYIKNELVNLMNVPSHETSYFADDVALICESHNEGIEWVYENLQTYMEKGKYSFNPQFCAILLRLADILDFDGQRTPPVLYHLINPKGFSMGEWQKHFVIDNKDKVKHDEHLKIKKITLTGQCSDVEIHRKVLDYIGWMNKEIKNANLFTEVWKEKYLLHFKHPVENNIKTFGFSASNLSLSVNYKSISKLLMGENLYGDKKLGLREIIQNSIDACQVKRALYNTKKRFGDEEYSPSIRIILDRNEDTITIEDNGIGMTKNIIEEYFLSIGNSYYRSEDYIYSGMNYTAIGSFGIGFLATFMLSRDVKVHTRHMNANKKITLLLSSDSEFVCMEETVDLLFTGTRIELNYREFMRVFDNRIENLKIFLSSYFITDSISLRFIDRDILEDIYILNELKKQDIDLNHAWIDASKYLKYITGFVKIEENSIQLTWPQVVSGDTFYFFNGIQLDLVDVDSFNFHQVYNNESNEINGVMIYYLTKETLPIYQEFLKSNKDDQYFHESQLDKVMILLDTECTEKFFFDSYMTTGCISQDMHNVVIKEYAPDAVVYEMIPDLKQRHINEVIKLDGSPVFIKRVKMRLILSSNTNEFLPLSEYRYYAGHNESYDNDLYLRDILVDKWRLSTMLVSWLVIEDFRLNIINKSIEPDISRSRLSDDSDAILEDALYALPYVWYLDKNLNISSSIKDLINRFLDFNYPKYKMLMRDLTS
ncbi:ATP-binding protein [Cohnella sp. GbtcB17]|uniref:HD domain-containing protein n=1 Tax=Cohnella sp. GbtcB17 TaxID=2824762 RepID=UPI0020C6AD26|nr:ATP-binding protein [Cohnella sp. GbtcB17]